jgi:hypothetical protein
MVAGQRIGGGAVAVPAQAQHRLPEAGQRPDYRAGAPTAAFGQQQLRGELGQFPGDVKRGTMGDHVEPSRQKMIFDGTCSTGAPQPISREARFVRESARPVASWGERKQTVHTYSTEITSMTVGHVPASTFLKVTDAQISESRAMVKGPSPCRNPRIPVHLRTVDPSARLCGASRTESVLIRRCERDQISCDLAPGSARRPGAWPA